VGASAGHGRHLVVLDNGEVAGDLVRGMMDVLTSFFARLCGRGAARNHARKALEAARYG
jgi:putative resolvase